MKKTFSVLTKLLLVFSIGILVTSSVSYDPVYYSYTPVYMNYNDMVNAVEIRQPKSISNPGKIYLYENYILLNEQYYGIHIIDNQNPENPVNLAFIHIDGCIDMAVKDGIIYADNAIDLISIKPSQDFSSIEVTSRIKNIFPEFEDPSREWTANSIDNYRPKDGVLVAWKKNN